MPASIDWLFVLTVTLFIVGFILIGIEIVIPGFNLLGLTGAVCLVAAIFLASDSFKEGAIITIIVLLLLGIMLAVILRLLSKAKLRSPVILKEELNTDKGYTSSNNLNYLEGKQGIAITDLRPSGTADFEGKDYDVISEGRYIVKGARLKVVKVEGAKIIVKQDD